MTAEWKSVLTVLEDLCKRECQKSSEKGVLDTGVSEQSAASAVRADVAWPCQGLAWSAQRPEIARLCQRSRGASVLEHYIYI